ncbi:type I secretion C-terminal target domain-containing protein [Endozoicomonas acroporae]|uniref:type I secretion C-terminal target domain-containing protein n=1 Tax=Endozoicomonas acroporae TaxID=1701104 RepID=UPI003D7BB52E
MVTGFHAVDDVIGISGYLPKEAENQPSAFMELSLNNTMLNLASNAPPQWTNTIELADVDWLQSSSSEDALRHLLKQGNLFTGLSI